MSRNVAVISGNKTVLEEIRKVFDRFEVAVAYLSTFEAILQDKQKYDLLLLDSSTTISELPFLQKLQSDDRFSSIASFDATDIPRDRVFWRTILPLMYHRVTGEQKRWPGTEVTWKLMESRVAGIVVGELLRLVSETDIPTISDNEADTQFQIFAQLDKRFFSLIDDHSFLSALAERLFSELPSLLWVEVTESLQ
jgi:hypothetical protein